MSARDVAAFFRETAPPPLQTERPATAGVARFTLERLLEIRVPSAPVWLVRDLLAASGLAIVYGAPGSGKSFAALDVALHIAAGIPYAGRKTRPAGVVYVAAEAGEGFRRRVIAAREHLGLHGDEPFAMVAAAPDLGTKDGDLKPLVEAIEAQTRIFGWKPGVVVLDTLARVIPGADENSSQAMGLFVSNADAIARRFSCLVLVVHHAGKAADAGMRGSSALHGAADTEWLITADGPIRTVKLVKSKEGADNLSWAFSLSTVEVGRDEDGEPITTCVVSDVSTPTFEAVSGKRTQRDHVPPGLRLFFSVLSDAVGEIGQKVRPFPDGPEVRAVKREALREAFITRHPAEEHHARKNAFNRLLKQAAERRAVVSADVAGEAFVWLA